MGFKQAPSRVRLLRIVAEVYRTEHTLILEIINDSGQSITDNKCLDRRPHLEPDSS